jgi:hypothetical protein
MQSDFALVRDALSRPRASTTPPPSGKGASPEPTSQNNEAGSESGDDAEQMNLFA